MITDIPDHLREALFIDNPHPGAVISREYKITEVNKRWVDLFGWSASEMESISLVDLAEMQRDKVEVDRKVLVMINTYEPYDRIEMVIRTKLGDLRKVRLTFIGVFNQERGGKFEYAIVWVKDLGLYEPVEAATNRLRRLWGYIVITTVALWLADFAELGKWMWSSLPGVGS